MSTLSEPNIAKRRRIPRVIRDEERALSVLDAAALLGISPWTLYTLIARRQVPHYKIGSRVSFDRSELLTWRQQHYVASVENVSR